MGSIGAVTSVHRPAAAGIPVSGSVVRRAAGRALAVACVAALALAGRLSSGWTAPLWFDETFSAVIANQPDAAALVDWCLHEIGGPVYYLLLWAWAHLVGGGATALRSFSLACSLAAPVAAWRLGPRAGRLNLLWAALLALWLPTFDHASNARCYALLLLVDTVQAAAFLRAMRTPTRARALAWTGASALAILTHYHSAVLAGVQGVLFLAVHGRAAVRCWPALAALAPMAGWMAFHLPILVRFSAGGTWYPPITPADLLTAPMSFFESDLIGTALGAGWIVVAVARARGWRIGDAPAPERATALAGVIGLAILLLLSAVKPSFTWRYAVVFAPSILLGVALWTRRLEAAGIARAPMLVLALFAGSAAGRVAANLRAPAPYRFAFNLDRPTAWLGDAHPRRLAFLWDSPTGTMSDPRRMAEVAGYFPKAAGRPVAVSVLEARPGTDPRRLVADRARAGAFDALVWISDASVPGTLAPADAGPLLRAGWQCRDFGQAPIAVLACRRPTATMYRHA